MSKDTKSHADNITMSGGGLYSLATTGAKDVIDNATERVLNAIDAMALPADLKQFSMADMGCADGGTSLEMVGKVLRHVRATAPGADLSVLYSDQPRNDFNALVSIVQGLTDFDSYVGDMERVYPLFSGNSFYLQALPDRSLNFGFSATAMHWLSRKPGNISDHVHMVGASGPEYDAFAEQGRQDWETILLCRARELVEGGRLVLVNFCRDEQGRYLGHTGGANMFDTLNSLWQDFLEAGRISEAEYRDMTLPQYYNTVEEFSAPLSDPASPVYQAGLRLESLETRIVPCPFAEAFKEHGDPRRFADGLIPTIRSWNESIFHGALDGHRDADERRGIIEDYYDEYHRRVVADPAPHGMGYVHAYKTIVKT